MKAVPKKAIIDPANWLTKFVDKGNFLATASDVVSSNIPELSSLTDELDSLKLARGKSNRKIGAAKAAGSCTNQLVMETQTLTQKIKITEQEIENHLQSIVSLLKSKYSDSSAHEEESSVGKPAYFIASNSAEPISATQCRIVQGLDDVQLYSEYVSKHSAKTAYHRYELKDLIFETTGQQCDYFIAQDESGTVRGVLPTTTLSSVFFGRYMVSMPWFNYGGPLADSQEISEHLLQTASQTAKQSNCSHAEFRETKSRSGWIEQSHKVSMILRLPGSQDIFENELKSSIRAQSNKAKRAGCKVQFGQANLLDDFYAVFSHKMRSLGTPIHNRLFFRKLLTLLGDEASICVVKLNNKPVAAGFLIAHGSTLEIPWASSLKYYDSMGVNMLMYRSILGNAANNRFEYFDFGRSTVDGPTYRFKKQWGAQPQPLFWHSWTAGGNPVEISQNSPKFQMAIAIWKKLPVWVTRIIGPRLIRGLP